MVVFHQSDTERFSAFDVNCLKKGAKQIIQTLLSTTLKVIKRCRFLRYRIIEPMPGVSGTKAPTYVEFHEEIGKWKEQNGG